MALYHVKITLDISCDLLTTIHHDMKLGGPGKYKYSASNALYTAAIKYKYQTFINEAARPCHLP